MVLKIVLAKQLHMRVHGNIYMAYTYVCTHRDIHARAHTETYAHAQTHVQHPNTHGYTHTLHSELMRLNNWYLKNVPQMILASRVQNPWTVALFTALQTRALKSSALFFSLINTPSL